MRLAVSIGYPILQDGVTASAVTGDPHDEVHWDMHRGFELIVVLRGHHERYYVGDLYLDMQPGDICFHPPWEPHGHRGVDEGTSILVAFFVREFLGDAMICDRPWLDFLVVPPAERPKVVTPETRARVLVLANEVAEEGARDDPGRATALRLGLLQLILTVARRWQPPASHTGKPRGVLPDLVRVTPALDLLYRELPHRRVALTEGAAACYLSRSRFAAIFHRAMGESFGQFVLRARLARAARRMLESDLSVEAAAEELGFASTSHFHHAFVQHYACTPAQYRKRQER